MAASTEWKLVWHKQKTLPDLPKAEPELLLGRVILGGGVLDRDVGFGSADCMKVSMAQTEDIARLTRDGTGSRPLNTLVVGGGHELRDDTGATSFLNDLFVHRGGFGRIADDAGDLVVRSVASSVVLIGRHVGQ